MSWVTRARDTCLACGAGNMRSILDLGDMHLTGFPRPDEPDPVVSPLHLVLCEACSLVQLKDVANPELLYRTYWYRSGTNQTMRNALRDITRAIEETNVLRTGDTVIDIGSNDGTLLMSYQTPGIERVGFEPSNIGREAQAAHPELRIVNDFFRALPEHRGRAKVVTSIAMFYDIEDPAAFIRDVKATLAPGGTWVLQLAYLPGMLARNAFDGICHEHLAYYSLRSLEGLFERNGLHAFDAEEIDLNEGSIRVFVAADRRPPTARLQKMREAERALGLGTTRPYEAFAERVRDLRERTVAFLRDEKAKGRKIHGYGASTKGNTLLQYYGLDASVIDAIWERQPQKWGRVTTGTRIPIVSEEDGRRAEPDLLLMLPWHFAREFVEREQKYLEAGGCFVIPLPEFKRVPHRG